MNSQFCMIRRSILQDVNDNKYIILTDMTWQPLGVGVCGTVSVAVIIVDADCRDNRLMMLVHGQWIVY